MRGIQVATHLLASVLLACSAERQTPSPGRPHSPTLEDRAIALGRLVGSQWESSEATTLYFNYDHVVADCFHSTNPGGSNINACTVVAGLAREKGDASLSLALLHHLCLWKTHSPMSSAWPRAAAACSEEIRRVWEEPVTEAERSRALEAIVWACPGYRLESPFGFDQYVIQVCRSAADQISSHGGSPEVASAAYASACNRGDKESCQLWRARYNPEVTLAARCEQTADARECLQAGALLGESGRHERAVEVLRVACAKARTQEHRCQACRLEAGARLALLERRNDRTTESALEQFHFWNSSACPPARFDPIAYKWGHWFDRTTPEPYHEGATELLGNACRHAGDMFSTSLVGNYGIRTDAMQECAYLAQTPAPGREWAQAEYVALLRKVGQGQAADREYDAQQRREEALAAQLAAQSAADRAERRRAEEARAANQEQALAEAREQIAQNFANLDAWSRQVAAQQQAILASVRAAPRTASPTAGASPPPPAASYVSPVPPVASAPSQPPAEAASCARSCGSRVCGDDGCGGTCGLCIEDFECGASGRCEPVRNRQAADPVGSESGPNEFSVSAGASYVGDTGAECCERLFSNGLARDGAVAAACKERNAYTVPGSTRWNLGAYCAPQPAKGIGWKFTCTALADGTCRSMK